MKIVHQKVDANMSSVHKARAHRNLKSALPSDEYHVITSETDIAIIDSDMQSDMPKNTVDIESLIVQGMDSTISRVKDNWDGSHPINYGIYIENIRNLLKYIDILEKSHGVSLGQLEEIGDIVDSEIDKLYIALAEGNIEDYELVKVLEYILRINSVIGR